jgi:hypothetical protein
MTAPASQHTAAILHELGYRSAQVLAEGVVACTSPP